MSTQWWRRLWQAVGTELTAPHQAGQTKRATADDVLLRFTIGEPSREDGPVTPLGSSGRGWVLWHPAWPAARRRRRWRQGPQVAGVAGAVAVVAACVAVEWAYLGTTGMAIPLTTYALVLSMFSVCAGVIYAAAHQDLSITDRRTSSPDLFLRSADLQGCGAAATRAAEAMAAALYQIHTSRALADGWLDPEHIHSAHQLAFTTIAQIYADRELRTTVEAAAAYPDLGAAARPHLRDLQSIDTAATLLARELSQIARQVGQLDAQLAEAEQARQREREHEYLADRLAVTTTTPANAVNDAVVRDVVEAITGRLQAIGELRNTPAIRPTHGTSNSPQ